MTRRKFFVCNLRNLRATHTRRGDMRSSLGVTMSLKCVQFDDLTLVDLVEPFTTTAILSHHTAAWDVRMSAVNLNVFSCARWHVVTICNAVEDRERCESHPRMEGQKKHTEFYFAHYTLHNACNVGLVCGQEGTGESVNLAAHSKIKYSWQSGLATSSRGATG
jgi:hypothetical protein